MTDKQFNELIAFMAICFSVLAVLIGVTTAQIIEKLPPKENKSEINSHISTTVETDNLIFE